MDGVHTTYLNGGMAGTFFGAHCEDSDLSSVNYLHHGKPKSWLCVPADEADKFEAAMKKILYPVYKCDTVWKHKCILPTERFLIEIFDMGNCFSMKANLFSPHTAHIIGGSTQASMCVNRQTWHHQNTECISTKQCCAPNHAGNAK